MRYIFLGLLLLAGCSTPFYQHIDGENDVIGIKGSTESSPLNVLSHLNGSKTIVQNHSDIIQIYSVTYSNSYFGVINISETRQGIISVNCKTNSIPN